MSRLVPLRFEEVVRKLRHLGFEGPIPGGRHARMIHSDRRQIIPLPSHGGRDIGVGLIRSIVRAVGITPDEWSRL